MQPIRTGCNQPLDPRCQGRRLLSAVDYGGWRQADVRLYRLGRLEIPCGRILKCSSHSKVRKLESPYVWSWPTAGIGARFAVAPQQALCSPSSPCRKPPLLAAYSPFTDVYASDRPTSRQGSHHFRTQARSPTDKTTRHNRRPLAVHSPESQIPPAEPVA